MASSKGASKAAVAPPPAAASPEPAVASGAPSRLADSPSKRRFDWIEQTVSEGSSGSIKAVRAQRGARSPSPGAEAPLWAGGGLLEGSVRSPELKAQLLQRALEDSRAKIQALTRERAALGDGLMQLCQATGMDPEVAASYQAATAATEDGPQQRMELLSLQLQQLQETTAAREASLAEARARQAAAASRAAAHEAERVRLEGALADARQGQRLAEAARGALELRAGLLEEQLGEAADSARRRMEEQLLTFRGEVVTARTLRTKRAELERQLEAAQRAQHEATERAAAATAQGDRLRGQLEDAGAKLAQQAQQLGAKCAAHAALEAQHAALGEQHAALGAAAKQLQASLGEHRERAALVDGLRASLEAQRCGAGQLEGVLQEEAGQLREALRHEREAQQGLQVALSEERASAAGLRAALQGGQQELASLLLRLDDWQARVVAAEAAAGQAAQRAQQEAQLKQGAETRAGAMHHECAALRDSLTELAAAEAAWREQLAAAQQQRAAAEAALHQAQQQGRELSSQLEDAQECVHVLQATLAEQGAQLGQMGELRQQCTSLQGQVATLGEKLTRAGEFAEQMRQAAAEAQGGREQAEREAYKLRVACAKKEEQSAKLAAQARRGTACAAWLETATSQLEAAKGQLQAAEEQATTEREEHQQAMAAELKAHQQRRTRQVQCCIKNEQLDHSNKQQAAVIAELQAAASALTAQVSDAEQRGDVHHRFAMAHGAAYGRLAAHVEELHTQCDKQLGGLLHLCRHLSLQLDSALTATGPVATGAGSVGVEQQAGAVAAAVLALEGMRVELEVAVRLLEAQSGSAATAALQEVAASVAEALQRDLAGLPATLPDPLSDRRTGDSSRLPSSGRGQSPPAMPPGPPTGVLAAAGVSAIPVPGAVEAAADPSLQRAASSDSRSSPASRGSPAAMSAQVGAMERQLERLMLSSREAHARAEAGSALHQGELVARRKAGERASCLAADLAACRAQLDGVEGERGELHEQAARLAAELRDAIYTISQLHVQQQGQGVSWVLRGLKTSAVQTQHCELWLRNLGGCEAQQHTQQQQCEEPEGQQQQQQGQQQEQQVQQGSQLQDSPCGSKHEAAVEGSKSGGRVLPLPDTLQLIRSIYHSKATHDIAVARGQRPFAPLADFVAVYFVLQHGSNSSAGQERAEQLQLSVEAHAAVHAVAMFGLAAGMLVEPEPPLEGSAQNATAGHQGTCATASAAATSSALACGTRSQAAAAAAVPLVLYNSRRLPISAGRAASQAALHTFCHADWHAAYELSALRPTLSPLDPARLLHPMCEEVHNLASSVPGVEHLAWWVLSGGVAGCLAHLDLGLPLAENQVPQVYLLVVETCRLLGIACTPRLYVRSSADASAHYLLLPASGAPPFHGFGGGLAPGADAGAGCSSEGGGSAASAGRSAVTPGGGLMLASPSSARMLGASSSSIGAAEGADGGGWECVVVLSSALLDLLTPLELQAVLAGFLSWHAALVSPAASRVPPDSPHESSMAAQQRQLRTLCRSMAALATLGALCTLGPAALGQQLPQQMAPFFAARVQPVLQRCGRYLAFFADRAALGVMGGQVAPVAAAVVKAAAGAAVLRNELNLSALLEQARMLDDAAGDLLPRLLRAEGGASAALAAAGSSLAVLRLREMLRWQAQREERSSGEG